MLQPICIDRISAEELYRVSKAYEETQKAEADDSPFMIIKPFGLEYVRDILDFIEEQGIAIQKETTIYDWKKLAKFLYLNNNGESIELSIARSKAHSQIEKGNIAVHLLLEAVPENKLNELKKELRVKYGGNETGLMLYASKLYTLELNCVHSADPERQDIESRVIRHYYSS
ncbi:hypothetical protein KY317_01330 [Candidatus Woesearchaeota archaeon]|nr:hypothetical protein [Candidatus Woesearchaeota archaeon]